MAFTAWSYAEMSRVVPHAGSVFAYATEGLGRPAGFLAGWLAMLDYLLIPSVAYLFSGHRPACAGARGAGLDLHGGGLRRDDRAQPGRRARGRSRRHDRADGRDRGASSSSWSWRCRRWPRPGRRARCCRRSSGWATFDPSVVVGAISVAVLSYLGFDAIAGFAEENAGDPREVGRAILFCLVVAGVAVRGADVSRQPAEPAGARGSRRASRAAGHRVLRHHAGGAGAVAGHGDRGDQGDRPGVRGDDRAGRGGPAAVRHGARRPSAAGARLGRCQARGAARPR